MSDEIVEVLIESARTVREKAYAPYSGFKVGAAVMSESGKIYVGCNVENASYGATLCAERSAIANMVAAGETALVSVAVYVDRAEPAMPCGVCRQVISEFGPHAEVIAATPQGFQKASADSLLPLAFSLDRS